MKGKIGWLVRGTYPYDDEEACESFDWEFKEYKPDDYRYVEVKKIVYFEVEEN